MDPQTSACRPIAAWTTPETKAQFAALAASRGLSESKLLGLLIDSVLARNPVGQPLPGKRVASREQDRISVRLRPGDGRLLRLRARARGMSYTSYVAALIRAHLRASPPIPQTELAKLDRSLSAVSAVGRSLGQIAQFIQEGQGADSALRSDLGAVALAVQELRQTLRELVKANRISWEAADAEAAS